MKLFSRGRQARQAAAELVTARDQVLGALRPPVPAGARGALLAAVHSPVGLWGRRAVLTRLVAWCTDPDAAGGVVRVVTGPGGVGKTRLGLAVAEALPAGWAAGWVAGRADRVVDRVVAAGEPTLLLVDEADRVAGLAALITRAAEHPRLVRVLLMLRDPAALHDVPPAARGAVEELGPVGGAADRRRWFAEAVRGYARLSDVEPPSPAAREVGADGDTMLVLHSRALLTALGHDEARNWPVARVFAELVEVERRSWDVPGADTRTLARAVTALTLLPADSLPEATELLGRVCPDAGPQVAEWVWERYPRTPDGRADPRPHALAHRLVLDTLAEADLVPPQATHLALPILLRCSQDFDDAGERIAALLRGATGYALPNVLIAVSTGIAGPDVDAALAALVSTGEPDPRLLRLLDTAEVRRYPRLRAALQAIRVDALPDDGDRAAELVRLAGFLHAAHQYAEAVVVGLAALESESADRAAVLANLAGSLAELGRVDEALDRSAAAVALHRESGERAGLAAALGNHTQILTTLGRPREAAAAAAEAVLLQEELAVDDPAALPALATALDRLGFQLLSTGRPAEAHDVLARAVTLSRDLVSTDPRARLDLVVALNNLSTALRVLGRFPEAVDRAVEAVALVRELAAADPAEHRPRLALALANLGVQLGSASRPGEAVTTLREAVALQRELAADPRHRVDLGKLLDSLGMALSEVGDLPAAVARLRESAQLLRGLDHRPDLLAGVLHNLGTRLFTAGQHDETRVVTEESIALQRELTARDRGLHRPALADFLGNHRLMLDGEAALAVLREEVALRAECAEADPLVHGPAHRRAVAELAARENGGL